MAHLLLRTARNPILWTFALWLTATGLHADGAAARLWMPKGAELTENIVYKETPQGHLTLDLYTPSRPTGEKSPVVLFIHGGSWMHGSKDEITHGRFPGHLLRMMLEEGIAVASMDYRLVSDTGSVSFPQPLADCKDALHWLAAHAAQWSLDPLRTGLMGTSAGAHLALMTAYAPDSLAYGSHTQDLSVVSPRCVVDIYGPTQLEGILHPLAPDSLKATVPEYLIKARHYLLQAFSGHRASQPAPLQGIWLNACRRHSPLTYAHRAVPTLALHGNKDTLVPYNQSLLLQQALQRQGMQMDIVTLEGLPHGFEGIRPEQVLKIRESIRQFLLKNLAE